MWADNKVCSVVVQATMLMAQSAAHLLLGTVSSVQHCPAGQPGALPCPSTLLVWCLPNPAGDVLLHTITDAILGALSLPDIGGCIMGMLRMGKRDLGVALTGSVDFWMYVQQVEAWWPGHADVTAA